MCKKCQPWLEYKHELGKECTLHTAHVPLWVFSFFVQQFIYYHLFPVLFISSTCVCLYTVCVCMELYVCMYRIVCVCA